MKKPRIEAFDPRTVQELHSPLEHMPAIKQRTPHPSAAPANSSASRIHEDQRDTLLHPYGRTGVRTDGRRTITRYAFEIYHDQVETFRQLALEEKLRGGKGSMSEMVRAALDAYIKEKKSVSV